MFERLTGQLLVALDEPATDTETQSARWALVAGRRCVKRGECPATRLAELGGLELRACFFDRAAHFERIVSQTANPRLAQIFARRHIDGQMLFSESYRLRTKIIPLGEADVIVRAMAATELACARATDALPLATRPVRLATLVETAIAALVARATTEPVLVCHARGSRFLSFLAEAGELRLRRLEFATENDPMALGDAVERATAQFAGSDAPQPAVRLLFGDLRTLAKEERYQRDSASREVEKKIAALISGADALAEPELFGLSFVQGHWNLLDPAQARGALAWKLGLPTAGLMLAGSAFAAILGGFQAAENAFLAARLGERRAALERQRDELTSRIPDEKESRRLAEFAELLKKRNEQVRVDRFLAWLTTQLPEGATVESLALYPLGEAPPEAAQSTENRSGEDILARIFGRDKAAPAATTAKPTPASAAGSYTAAITVSLPGGGYERVEALAATAVSALGERLAFERAVLDYDAANTRARIYLRATLSRKDFAR